MTESLPFVVRGASFVVIALAFALRTLAAQPPLPELTAPVNDFANVIEPADEQQLDAMIRSLQTASGDVVVIATVDTVAPYYGTARDYAVKLFENRGRGIGERGKDNGVPELCPEYGEHYYAAFVIDPDGYRIEAVITEPV